MMAVGEAKHIKYSGRVKERLSALPWKMIGLDFTKTKVWVSKKRKALSDIDCANRIAEDRC